MVKQATAHDLPAMLDLGRRFHAMSPWKDKTFCDESTMEMLARMDASDDAVVFFNGSGVLGGLVSPIYFGGGKVAQELFWFADKNGAELLTAFENWAKEKEADGIMMVSLALDEKTDGRMNKIYERRGYKLRERTYYKDVI